MEEPFTIKIKNLQDNIIKNINESKLPAFCVNIILQEINKSVQDFDKKEIDSYYKKTNNNIKEEK